MSSIVSAAKSIQSRGLRQRYSTASYGTLTGGPSNGLCSQNSRLYRAAGIKQDISGIWALLCDKWYLNVMLLMVPLAIASPHIGWDQTVTFALNLLAILPLANLLGTATEELSFHTGEIVGGLLNATFGNAVELIVALSALSKGLITVVQGSLLGSILSNLLLVLGASFFVGGVTNMPEQTFNSTAASTFSALLLISVIGLLVPTVFHSVLPPAEQMEKYPHSELMVSRAVALVLGGLYFVYLLFQLKTHQSFFTSEVDEENDTEPVDALLSVPAATGLLLAATILVALCSDNLTGAIEPMAACLSPTFIGVILLPIVGNAAEHLTAVTMAVKNKMNLAIGVAVGSSSQIALFVIPLVTLVGWAIDQPMDLNFNVFNSVLLLVSVLIVNLTLIDGKSNYLEGLMLLAVYCIIGVACWFSPMPL